MTDDMAARFARDTANHQMTVRRDDGLYRHLSFANPEHSWAYWFDLVTVPGALIFYGDGDSFVFRRLEDMFEFFRSSACGGQPNIGYWAEKLTSGTRGVMVYQEDLLQRCVDEAVAEAVKDNPKLAGLPDAVREYVTAEMVGNQGYDWKLVDDFAFWIDPDDKYAHPYKEPDFRFYNPAEWTIRDYHWWFLWACHAIVWGIAQYDSASVAASDTTEGTT